MQRLSALTHVDEMLTILFDLDCLILGRAAAGLHELVGIGGRTQLIVPVNFNSLNTRTQRGRYLKLCEDIPPAYRRFLLFEICNIPPGTPGARILDLIMPLNAHAHGTFIEASLNSVAGLTDCAGSAIMGVVTRADQFVDPAAEASVRLNQFVTRVRAKNLRVFLNGVNSAELLRSAIAAGVDCVGGLSVAETTRELKTVYPWDITPPQPVRS